MLEQELSEMDRVTQLQDAIEEVRLRFSMGIYYNAQRTQLYQLFGCMSGSIKYLSTASSTAQVNPDIPITKVDPLSAPPDEFEGWYYAPR